MSGKISGVIPEVPYIYRRGVDKDEASSVANARDLMSNMAAALSLPDLSQSEVLDVGCGVKFTQAILTHDIPIKSYSGLDVFGAMLRYMRQHVDDPRFSYYLFDVRNELYAPDGAPMTDQSGFEVEGRRFDVICGFSLFTHLNPDDFEIMLKLMRKVIQPGGKLYFSAFLNDLSEGGFGYIDTWMEKLSPEVKEEALKVRENDPVHFIDLYPEEPLLVAMYSREFATEIVERSGWKLVDILDPLEFVQHQFVCEPA